MEAIVFVLLFWVAPVFVGHKIGAPKGRRGWLYGLFGWIGVIIIACLGPTGNATRSAAGLTSGGVNGQQMWPPIPAAALPAGWYADPAGGAFRRYWDGTQWTEDLAPSVPAPQ